MADPTPAQIEAANDVIRRGNEAAAKAKREETRAVVEPFLAAGLGSQDPESPIRRAIKALRDKALTLQAIDANAPNAFFVTANCLENADDKIRSLAALSADPPAPPVN